jgi:hypothetical protein
MTLSCSHFERANTLIVQNHPIRRASTCQPPLQKPSKLHPLSFIYTESWYVNFSRFGYVVWTSFGRFSKECPLFHHNVRMMMKMSVPSTPIRRAHCVVYQEVILNFDIIWGRFHVLWVVVQFWPKRAYSTISQQVFGR